MESAQLHLLKKNFRNFAQHLGASTLIIGCILCFAPLTHAQQRLAFRHLTVEEGLSQNTVNDILQDSLGMLWVGTQNGLNRYNGYEFEVFESRADDSLTLSSSFINCLALGQNNTIWIGTKRGLCQWDQKLGVFFRMSNFFANDTLNGQYEIGDIFVDSDNGVWVMAEHKGFHIFHKSINDRYFKKILALNDAPGTNIGFYGQIMEDESGNIWVGTSRFGLWTFARRDRSVSHIELNINGNPPITSVIQHKGGDIWVGTLRGLFVSKDHGKSFAAIQDFDNISIRCLYYDRLNRLWIGTDDKGLLLHLPAEKKFAAFDHNLSDPASLLHNSVQRIFLDKQDILWVGTYAGGLNYHNPMTNAFQVFQAGTSNNLTNNSVTAFAEDPDGNVWIATDRGGLNLFKFKGQTFHHYRAAKFVQNSISSDIIQHICPSAEGNLWIGHWSTGLDYFDRTSGRVTHFTHQPELSGSLSSNSINYILNDKKGELWLATDAGLNRLDSQQLSMIKVRSPSFEVFKHDPSNRRSLSDSYVRTIYQGHDGKIWIGTWEGLNLWNEKTSSFINFRNNPKRQRIFTSDYILCIAQGQESNMLIGTNENGLMYYIQATDSLIYFNKQTGFPSSTIVGLQKDDNGLWWISTTNGLLRFDEKDFTYLQYKRHDGLPSNEFRQNATGRLKDGHLLFGSNNGFVIFHPDSVKVNTKPPTVSLTKLKVFNSTIKAGPGSILSNDISVTKQITLPYDQSSIGFHFTAINFTASAKNTYAYKLVGVDKEWNYVGNQRTASYSYIPPGRYVFSLKAANNDGVWCHPIDVVVIVTPPWWGTAWFKVFAVCAIIGVLVLAYKIRTRQLKKTKKRLESLVLERTVELIEKNTLLSQRQEEIFQQKEQLLVQRDHVKRQFDTIQTLSEIGQKITASLKKEDLITQLHRILEKLMDVDHFSIGHLDKENRLIEFSALKRSHPSIEESIVTLDQDRFSVLCIEQNKVIRINDVQNEYADHFDKTSTRYLNEDFASAMYLPLLSTEGSITGILVVKSRQLYAYTDVHLSTLKNLAAYIGIAFENANIYKALEAQSELVRRQSTKLEELDKLKTRFFVNISHEFRTPLTLIITPLEQILSEDSSKEFEEMHQQLWVMHKNAKTLLHLINELLEIRSLESTGIRKVAARELDIVLFTKSVLTEFAQLSKTLEIELSLSHDKEKIFLWFDPDMIHKVLSNLYSNAFKYTAKGGSIQTKISVSSYDLSDYAMIQIHDNGIGIDQSELPFVFERFYQGDAPINPIQQSSGIGLSLIKDLLDLHAGKIEVESQRGVGSCFTILLPLARVDSNSKTQIDFRSPQSDEIAIDERSCSHGMITPRLDGFKQGIPQVLVVEDNDDVRELLRNELKSEFHILEAANGKDGIDHCLEHIPDLVLSDIMMPVMDGIALCEFIKTDERTCHVPVILLTAKSGEHSQIKGLTIGADDYIAKPFNIKILRARILNLIESRRKLHALFSSKEKLKIKEVIENSQDRAFIEKVDAQIFSNIKNIDLNHETLGREIGMSKTQLYRKLQAITGKSVHEYIRNYRLRIAYELLTEKPDLLISEIAYEVGFKDPSYFSKSFFAFYNVWPKQLRKGLPVL